MNPGRNDPCPCGSGKKFKKCCQANVAGQGAAPNPVELNHLVALFNARRHAELERRARSLLERYPHSGFAWKVLGAALQIQGKDSLAALWKAAELLPDDAVAHYNLGNILHERGHLGEAEISYREALRIKPDNADAHVNL